MIPDYSKITEGYKVLPLLHNEIMFCVCHWPAESNIATFFYLLDSLFEFINNSKFHVVCGGNSHQITKFQCSMIVQIILGKILLTLIGMLFTNETSAEKVYGTFVNKFR